MSITEVVDYIIEHAFAAEYMQVPNSDNYFRSSIPLPDNSQRSVCFHSRICRASSNVSGTGFNRDVPIKIPKFNRHVPIKILNFNRHVPIKAMRRQSRQRIISEGLGAF